MLSSRRSSLFDDKAVATGDKHSEGSGGDSSNSGSGGGGSSLFSKLKTLVRPSDGFAFNSSSSHLGGSGGGVDDDSQQPAGATSSVIAEKDFTKLGTTVRQILEHATLGPKFRVFAKSFHADEGIQFLDELALAAAASSSASSPSSSEDVRATCQRLMERYFLDGASCWVNLPNSIHDEMLEQYSSGTYSSVQQLFESAMYETFTDLKKSDTFRKFCMEDKEAKSFANNADVILLDALMTPEHFRAALQAVETTTSSEDDGSGSVELVNLVRFCASVGDFERTASEQHSGGSSKERKARAQKIFATFIQSGAQFHVDLPPMYVTGVEKGVEKGAFYDKMLSDAKTECLQKLCKHEPLLVVARKHTVASRHQSSKPSLVSSSSSSVLTPSLLHHFFSSSKDGGRELVALCAANKLDAAVLNKLKFLAATAAFVDLPGNTTNKTATARKIVSNFIQPGANFEIADIGSGFVDDLTKPANPDFNRILPVVFHNVLSDVASVPEVVDLATKLVVVAAVPAE